MNGVKRVSKTQRALDFLELISEPNSHDIIAVSKKVNCSERLVWRALRRLREKSKKTSGEFSILKELISDFIFLNSFMESKMTLRVPTTSSEKWRLNQISEHLDIFKDDIKLQEYMKLKEEMEARE